MGFHVFLQGFILLRQQETNRGKFKFGGEGPTHPAHDLRKWLFPCENLKTGVPIVLEFPLGKAREVFIEYSETEPP